MTGRRPLVPLTAGAVLLVAAGWVVGFTGVFGVRHVVVNGVTGTVTVETVQRAAAVPLGDPLARLDVSGIAGRVGRLPGVAHVRVSRAWPATARIDVVERSPVAVVPDGPALWLVDVDGVLFERVKVVPATLPRLVLVHPHQIGLAGRAALTVLGALPSAIRAKVSVVEAPTGYSVTLGLRDGRTVVWGGADDSALKARVLAVLLARPGSMYDVSTPSVAVVR
ncbi:MAG: FtsQ-type POTRA domain-containing protein [Actinobacteria bacterium]|nr:FtsQ-type POTRA domain-containing protein [Actinomycetota bacterium]